MNLKKRFSQGLTLAVLALAFGTLAYAAQGVLKTSTYYTAASTNTSNLSRIAPTANLAIEIVTASASGVPSVTPTVQGIDSAGNAYNICAGDAIAAAGTRVIQVGPALTAGSGAVGTTTLTRCNAVVPDTVRVNLVNASGVGTDGITSTIYYNTSP